MRCHQLPSRHESCRTGRSTTVCGEGVSRSRTPNRGRT
jgi:hypothetical protein